MRNVSQDLARQISCTELVMRQYELEREYTILVMFEYS